MVWEKFKPLDTNWLQVGPPQISRLFLRESGRVI